jgi:primosomal protein N' (replication factor Y) (superfamily II helicase)
LRQHDYHAFASSQLDERRVASLPPFSYLGLLRAEAKTAQAALGFLQAAAQLAATLPGAEQVLLYPAVPTSVARVANVERMQMLVESSSRLVLQRLLTHWMAMLPALRNQHRQVLRWALDVDPLGI